MFNFHSWKMKKTSLYCQARVPGLTYRMVKHFREKLKSHRESQKGTRADTIIQIHHPPHNSPKLIYIYILHICCQDVPVCQETAVCQKALVCQEAPVRQETLICQDTL